MPNAVYRRAILVAVKIALISTYELGRQPFGLASPAAWLRKRGHSVICLDLSRQALNEGAVRAAELIAFYVPMHTATRLAGTLIPSLRKQNPTAHFCCYGLYAPMNAEYLRKLGVETVIGGEFEKQLADLAEGLKRSRAAVSLERLEFEVPDRSGLAPLRQYAHLVMPSGKHRTVGYTEASRGCKHLCRHCPIVPVYNGIFRVVDRHVVLADIRQQVAAGAEHITFGDPDFFNGTGHAMAIVEALHREFPGITYDVTIKVEHLRKHEKYLRVLRDTGCLFVTSAVESLDDHALQKLEKGHTREDFLHVAERFRELGLTLQPTFVPFTPWTTLEGYLDLLQTLNELELGDAVAPIQLGIRLLIPAGSRLLELDDIKELVGLFDEAALVFPWRHSDARVDALCEEIQEIVASSEKLKRSRAATFARIWRAAKEAAGVSVEEGALPLLVARAAVPYLNEPWYC
jgi:radical SAM superfamily enzyme YgiQ (UPF0313 family)